MAENRVAWSNRAITQFSKVLDHIRQDSIQNADKVYEKMIKKLDVAALNPNSCPLEKYKIDNDGSVRAFVLFKYRVIYKIEPDRIRVLRIRHSKMKVKYF